MFESSAFKFFIISLAMAVHSFFNAEGLKNQTEFQFQYGAIKSALTEPKRVYVSVFQFQYGAIKSEFSYT